ncbi:hypothetical protein [Clostridium thermarum]|uniref:hypothetical protein n=1 Tax=Clostridium thermarum TaxID=1716543 RepID=UPI001FABC2FE|nr:hypothetical protein [Clostridium thermarum]
MLYYKYPYDDNLRFEEPEEIDGIKDLNELYALETDELPPQCPYRQILPPIFPFNVFGGGNAPTTPPPNFTPNKSVLQAQGPGGPSVLAVDPGAIRPCTFRFVYIWPRRGTGFWAYLTFVGRRSAAGFRWNGRRWSYFGIDLRNIESFQCF